MKRVDAYSAARFGLCAVAFLTAAPLLFGRVPMRRQAFAKSPSSIQTRQKNLRETALERDVAMSGDSSCQPGYADWESLAKEASAVVYGRIINSEAFFDESGGPLEYGENITTEYAVDVYQVLRETRSNVPLEPDRPEPAALSTPMKIARHGGVVYVNGHRAELKVKGYEALRVGGQYVFFLFWSPDYKAFVLAGGLSGVVTVNDDQSLESLASSEDLRSKLGGLGLENLANEISRRDRGRSKSVR